MAPNLKGLLLLMALSTSSLAADVAELEAVTWEMERRGLIAPDFGAWQRRHRPEYDWTSAHFGLLDRHLDSLTAGDIDRLLLQVAVRHGKTESLTGYMAYRIELDPTIRILFGTYGQLQSLKISKLVRRLVRGRGIALNPETDTAGEWETTQYGGLRAVGEGTGVASVNADLIVLDDPIGRRADAESQVIRDRVWDWITTDILARAEPHTQVVFSMPRWHHDDPSGRLQARHGERWTLIDLPGLAEAGDALGREPGAMLWPSHRPESWFEQMRAELGSWGFASAVQCRPSPREGGMFKWAWLQERFVDAVPVSVKSRVRYWDTAGTEGGGDFTAGVRMSLGTDGLYYIEHVHRGQWSPGHRDRHIKETCSADGPVGAYQVGLEQDAGVGGQERTRAIVAMLAGHSVFTERPTGSKESRADPVASQMEVGNVRIVRGDWNHAFIEELLQFPHGLNDDQVDAMSGAFARLSTPVGAWGTAIHTT